ncbi:MAG: hypothetical protein C5B43_04180 [Verrucomicrobia bacterium]|nr:MAG: hypothetical protein C5B43_04180 [Verrucomicrobiota bacterium]
MRKSIGELIDELCITNIKIFMLMEKDDYDQKKLKSLNRYRSDLKNAINEEFKQRQEIKTYGI